VIWIFVVGTLWWYLLARSAQVLWLKFVGGREPNA
jgi:hypothetical protein